MRYLGTKKKLLDSIEAAARRVGFHGGTMCDLFAGTAVVGRHFRALGSRVAAMDLMACSFVFQKVFLEIERLPEFRGLGDLAAAGIAAPEERIAALGEAGTRRLPGDPLPLLRVLYHLETRLEPCDGILTRQYSPAGCAGRKFLRPERARRLDAILLEIRDWRERARIDDVEEILLLAATIDAADRIANISGTYGAFHKEWQVNTAYEADLRIPALVAGPRGSAAQGDSLAWIPEVEADLLYIDPPYNTRQYPNNYHLLELIARIPRTLDLAALEASIAGKTGLVPWSEQASKLCVGRGTTCRDAFQSILARTRIPRVVISYNEEGIITRAEFMEMLAEYAGVARAKLRGALEEISYRRFRSDRDGRLARTGAGRRYRVVPGRARDEVREWLFAVAKRKERRPRARVAQLQ